MRPLLLYLPFLALVAFAPAAHAGPGEVPGALTTRYAAETFDVDAHCEVIRHFREAGDRDRAVEFVAAALELFDRDEIGPAYDRIVLGRSDRDITLRFGGVEELLELSKAMPDDPEVLWELGSEHQRADTWKEGIPFLREAIRRTPTARLGRRLRAQIASAHMMGKTGQAQALFDLSEKVERDHAATPAVAAIRIGKFVWESGGRSAVSDPDDRSKRPIWVKARVMAKEALAQFPGSAGLYWQLAVACTRCDREGEAAEAYGKLLESRPEDWETHSNLAGVAGNRAERLARWSDACLFGGAAGAEAARKVARIRDEIADEALAKSKKRLHAALKSPDLYTSRAALRKADVEWVASYRVVLVKLLGSFDSRGRLAGEVLGRHGDVTLEKSLPKLMANKSPYVRSNAALISIARLPGEEFSNVAALLSDPSPLVRLRVGLAIAGTHEEVARKLVADAAASETVEALRAHLTRAAAE